MDESAVPTPNGENDIQDTQPFVRWRGPSIKELPVLRKKGLFPNSTEQRMHVCHVGVEILVSDVSLRDTERIRVLHKRDIQVVEVVVHQRDRNIQLMMSMHQSRALVSIILRLDRRARGRRTTLRLVLRLIFQSLHPRYLRALPIEASSARILIAIQILIDQIHGLQRPYRRVRVRTRVVTLGSASLRHLGLCIFNLAKRGLFALHCNHQRINTHFQRLPNPPRRRLIHLALQIAQQPLIPLHTLRKQLQHLLVTHALHILIAAPITMVGALRAARSTPVTLNLTLAARFACAR